MFDDILISKKICYCCNNLSENRICNECLLELKNISVTQEEIVNSLPILINLKRSDMNTFIKKLIFTIKLKKLSKKNNLHQ